MGFELAAFGKSDRDVARSLNDAGYYRTSGNQGPRLFSNYTVRGMLTNRFYLGEISDGNGGWLNARHGGFVSQEVFEAAQEARDRNRHNPARTTRADARVSSLSGVARCHECGATLRTMRNRGVARMVCNTRLKRGDCSQKSARLDIYEAQLQDYLNAFSVPEDYQQRLLEAQRQLTQAYDDTEGRRKRLQQALDRLKDLYKWGDLERDQYQVETREIEEELATLKGPADVDATMDTLASFLRDVSSAWREATQERRNKLARSLFDSVWIDKQ